MIAVLKNGTTPSQIQHLVDWLKNMNLDVHISEGSEVTILGLVGDTSRVDIDLLKSLEMVETVSRSSRPTGNSTPRTPSSRRETPASAAGILP